MISSFDECPLDVEIESIATFLGLFVDFGFVGLGYFFTVLVFGWGLVVFFLLDRSSSVLNLPQSDMI